MLEKAQLRVKLLESAQSKSVEQAKTRYKLKFNRNSPAGYDKWFVFAQRNKCIIDDYDVLQRDIDPFYRLLSARQFRERVQVFSKSLLRIGRFKIKNGTFEGSSANSLIDIIKK
ncbi:F-actin-capping protein subunit beta, partial [Nowakowskiella sp. JEL0078]